MGRRSAISRREAGGATENDDRNASLSGLGDGKSVSKMTNFSHLILAQKQNESRWAPPEEDMQILLGILILFAPSGFVFAGAAILRRTDYHRKARNGRTEFERLLRLSS
jgi:hypothetical protein